MIKKKIAFFTFSAVILFGNILASSGKKKKKVLPDYSKFVKREIVVKKRINFFPGGKLFITTFPMGNLKIEGWDKAVVYIEANITAWGQNQSQSEKNSKLIFPRITHTQTDMHIETETPGSFNMGKIDYKIEVPKYRTDFVIKSNHGFISMEDVNGWMEIDNEMGYLSFLKMSGYISAKTKDGDILVQLKGTRWQGLQFAAVTDRGDIKIYIPTKYNADLTLITLNGDIHVDYPTIEVDGEEVKIVPVKKKKGAGLSFRLRDGGPSVICQTKFGHIYMIKYDPALEYLDTSKK